MALPIGYSQLRYIQSSGTQYIDTGFIPNQDTRVVMETEFTIQGSNQFLYGSRAGEKSRSFCFNCYNTKYRAHYNTSWLDYDTTVSYNEPFVIDHDKSVTTLNGEHIVTNTYAAFTCPYSLVLFAKNDGGTVGTFAKAKLYSCKVYDNSTLVRDFVPAMNSDGTVGLYDTINDVFYTNAGSGTFTAGPSVTGPVEGTGVTIIAGVSFAIKEGMTLLNGVARKITEGMTMIGGVAKRIALQSGIDVAVMAISYSGAYTDQKDVVMSGKTYRLLTLTGSGTLTVPEEVRADVWMVGGGSNGYKGTRSSYPGYGGAGGFSKFIQNCLISGYVTAVVGAANGKSSFAGTETGVVNGISGGTAGGSKAKIFSGGTGDGLSKYPFEDSEYFQYPHSGGGGGGGIYASSSAQRQKGFDGGTNGEDSPSTQSGRAQYSGGAGGERGGGKGVDGGRGINDFNNATYYGSGGGGGMVDYSSSSYSYGGSGYQGVIYVRIPYEQ